MLGGEPARSLGDSPLAHDQRLAALGQGVADAGPFLEGDRAGLGEANAVATIRRHRSSLILGNSEHQVGHRVAGRLAVEEDLVDLVRDRHLDAALLGLVVDAPGGGDPFGDVDHAREHGAGRLAPADPLADGAVAAVRAVAGRDQVADAGQAGERRRLRPRLTANRVISTRPRVSKAALALSPKPRPSQIPAAIPRMFFKAPASSTPSGVGVGVDAEQPVVQGVAHRPVERLVAPPHDDRGGQPRASSSAWLGPLRTATERVPSVSTMIWLGRANVAFSIPLTTLSTGIPGGIRSLSPSRVARRNAEGIATTIRSAPPVASQALGVTSTSSGSLMPGRWRTFSRVPGQLGRVRGVARPELHRAHRLANRTASAVPIPPAPRIATRFIMPADYSVRRLADRSATDSRRSRCSGPWIAMPAA